jgi:NADPH-dependent glutamate synthase beta subunit-like oxidoreductase
MDHELLREREARCVQENPPGCTAGCPVHVDVRGMIAAVRKGDYAAGFALFRRMVPFPGIISRVCDQPCRQACIRNRIDDPISIGALEKICVDNNDKPVPPIVPLPLKDKKAAIVGAGLSGLTAALELARKGYRAVVFEATDRLGGSIRDIPESRLPSQLIENDFAVFAGLPVEIRNNTAIGDRGGSVTSLTGLCEEYDAVYLGIGCQEADSPDLGLERDAAGNIAVDPVTLATSHPRVFAGGSLRRGCERRSPIASIADGKMAANSIDRLLQGASLTASREKEGPYATALYTNVAGVETRPAVPAGDPAGGYTRKEAAREADRCLLCECRECVKACEYLAHFGAYPKRYVREVFTNLTLVKGHHTANKLINTCSLCGLCEQVCPGSFDMGEVCREARRMMVERGKMPPSVHDFALRDMKFSAGEAFALSRHQPGRTDSKWVFYPGCQQAASSPQAVRNAYEFLCGRLDGGVGLMLGCCGAPANWAGQENLFQDMVKETENNWRALGSPTIITACPTCWSMFHHNLPAARIEPLWTLLDRVGPPGRQAPGTARRLAVHDSCTTRHENRLHDSVRSLLAKLGHEVEELPHNRDKTICCGYGGLMIFADREVARKTIARRSGESAADFLTYCAMCRDNFVSQGKRTFYLLDLLFGAGEPNGLEAIDYSQRRENRGRLKRELLGELWGERMAEPQTAVKIIIPDDVRRVMEERMILVADVTAVVAHAEATGDKLQDTANGHYLASHRPVSVTYWVEYSPQGDGFLIHNAYSHRIEILY